MGFKLSGLKLPGFNKKKEVTDSSTTFEEKKCIDAGENEPHL